MDIKHEALKTIDRFCTLSPEECFDALCMQSLQCWQYGTVTFITLKLHLKKKLQIKYIVFFFLLQGLQVQNKSNWHVLSCWRVIFPLPTENQEHNYKKKKEHGERCFTSPVLGCKTIRHKSASKETKVTRSCKMPLLRDVESLSLPLSTSLYIGASPFESTETVPEYQRDHCSPWHGTWQV